MFRISRPLLGLALAAAVATGHAKGSSHVQPPAPAAASGTGTPCWYQVPGRLQMVNLKHLAEVRVIDESKERYRVLLNGGNGSYSRLAEIVVSPHEAAQLMEGIRSTSLECR